MSASLASFARHELRLAWRDALWWLKSRRHAGLSAVVVGAVVLASLHLIAGLVVDRFARTATLDDIRTLILVTGAVATAWTLMVSQAIESVTRVLYARGDVDLILSSPAPAALVFRLRLLGIAASGTAMALLVMGPFVNMLAWQGGAGWLSAYPVILAMGASAAAIAMVLTLALFRLIGPRRTRTAAQIVAAVTGALIVIGLQVAAVLGHQGLERMAVLRSDTVLAMAPPADHPLWWPARAVLGDPLPLIVLLMASAVGLAVAVPHVAGHFARGSSAASHMPSTRRVTRSALWFGLRSPIAVLRRKEIVLLARDPWLLSQSLMQVLYLLPPALLLWQGFGGVSDPAPLIVPVIVMAAGQLAGGLAWLAISGEDCPDLIATAPVAPSLVLRAKVEAVMLCVMVPLAPLVLGLAILSPAASLVGLGGILCAAAASTAIQFFFRTTARRSLFRRRQTASRVATFAEAFSSIAWAGAAALAAAGSPAALAPALIALGVVGLARLLAPAR